MTPGRDAPERFVLTRSGVCLYHCAGRTRPRPISNGRGTLGWVYVCPGGTVSTVAFLGIGRRPSPARIRRYLQSRTKPPERVQLDDLRSATRHGPELGRAAERWAARPGAPGPLHLLYWRRYPRKRGRRYSYLYACFRHGAGEVRFYVAPSSPEAPPCPFDVPNV
jgi:hypothetical protein